MPPQTTIYRNKRKIDNFGLIKTRACLKTSFWVRGSGFLRRGDRVDDETYREYVEQVAVKNPLPQRGWGFWTCFSFCSLKNEEPDPYR